MHFHKKFKNSILIALAIFTFSTPAFANCNVTGDYNNDNLLNVCDLVLVFRCGLLIDPPPCQGMELCSENMDVNNDGINFDILDIVEMVNIILDN